MKSTVSKIFFAMVAFMIVATVQNTVQAQGKEDSTASLQSANRIVGAWETTITPRNCETGDPIAPPFQGVLTFNEGGTLAEVGANPATPYRTPGHGIWVNNDGGSSYKMKFSFLPLTPAGVPIGRMRVTQDIDLPRFGDEATSVGGFVLSNFAGVVLATGCSTSTAVRLTF